MDYPKEISYTPKHNFTYAKNGEEVYAQSITVKAPTMSIGQHTMIIGQEFKRADSEMGRALLNGLSDSLKSNLVEMQRERMKESKSDKVALPLKPEEVIETLMTGGANMTEVLKAFRSILFGKDSKGKPFCFVDQAEAMTQTIFNDMNPSDVLGLLGEYIVNFIVASRSN